jgi:small subunit ribosomal protein S10e
MMLIPKQNIKQIHQYLLQEGVVVIKKDFRLPQHEEIPVPNLQVIKCLQSLKSRGYVTEQFNWQYYYYFLTDSGIQYLRDYLHAPENTLPLTITKASKSAGRLPREGGDDDGERRRRGPPRKGADDASEYRRGGWRGERSAPAAATA